MPCQGVLGFQRAVEVQQGEGGVHVRPLDGRQHTVCTFEQSHWLLMELEEKPAARLFNIPMS